MIKKPLCLLYFWFGSLPPYFYYWLFTASQNKDVDFYIYTDQSINNPYCNIFVYKESLLNVSKKLSDVLGFEVNIIKPYKICDARPFYCYLVDSFIDNYLYWGFGDIDVLLGDMRDILNKLSSGIYDCLLSFGHLEIIKNEKKINDSIFAIHDLEIIKKVFESDLPYYFDEGNNSRYYNLENTYSDNSIIADCAVAKPYLECHDKKMVFLYENSKLYGYYLENGKLNKKEYLYVHFQKRTLKVENCNNIRFVLTSSKIFSIDDNVIIDVKVIKKLLRQSIGQTLDYAMIKVAYFFFVVFKKILNKKNDTDLNAFCYRWKAKTR